MAISLSAAYLYQGTKILSRTAMPEIDGEQNGFQCPEAVYIVARAVYSLGVVVIAPIGILYHEAAKGICYAQRFLSGRNIVELNRLMQEHDVAAEHDKRAWFTSLTGVVFTVLAVAGVYFQAGGMLVLALIIPALALVISYGDNIPFGDLFLTYNYATLPACFMNYLPVLQQEIYGPYYIYNGYVRAGVAVDQPLTPQEIQGINEIRRNFVMDYNNSPLRAAIEIHRALQNWNKITPAWQARSQAIVQQAENIERAWREAGDEGARHGGTLEEMRAHAASNFLERLRPILAALPPVGAPVPAAAQA